MSSSALHKEERSGVLKLSQKNHGSTLPFVFGPSFKSRRRGNLERKEFLLYGTIVLLIPGGKADIVVSVDIF